MNILISPLQLGLYLRDRSLELESVSPVNNCSKVFFQGILLVDTFANVS